MISDKTLLPVVQLYPVPPDCDLRLGPGQAGALPPAEGEPDHQPPHVSHLVRVAVIVVQQSHVTVPQCEGGEGPPRVPDDVLVVAYQVPELFRLEVGHRVLYQLCVPLHSSLQFLDRLPGYCHTWPGPQGGGEGEGERVGSGPAQPGLSVVLAPPAVQTAELRPPDTEQPRACQMDEVRLLSQQQSSRCLQPAVPVRESLPCGLLGSALAMQPQKVPGPHHEDLATVTLSVTVSCLLEGKEDHPVNDGRLVTAESPHCYSLPGIVKIYSRSPHL